MLTCSAIMYHSLRICGTCINVSNGHSSTSKQQRSRPLLEDNGWNVSKRNQVKIVVMRSQIISLHTHSVWETICDALARWSGWKFGSKIPVYPILGLGSQNTPRPPPQENVNLGNKTHSNCFYRRHECSLKHPVSAVMKNIFHISLPFNPNQTISMKIRAK